jgi:CHASE3 domain sensor protein
MTKSLGKIALQTTIPVLCGLIVLNAYLVSRNVKLMQQAATRRVEASRLQADISNVVLDLKDMETGQRGYLITGDPSYLQPYNEANERLAAHFAKLRSRLAGESSHDRWLEAQLESVAESKIAEMKETIRLRELGYRHRAFQLVSSDRGKELMNEARTKLDALSSAQRSNVARYDEEMKESISRTFKQLALASCILLAVTVVALLGFNRYSQRLEAKYARNAEQLEAASLLLEQFTSTIFYEVRTLVGKMRSYANALLEVYGGFLPRQGQEKAEHIEHEAGQTILLLDNLFKASPSGSAAKVVEVQPLQRLSA